MSIVEQMHADHKARQIRLGAIQPPPPVVIHDEADKRRIRTLSGRVEHLSNVIEELQKTIRLQREIIVKYADESEQPTPRVSDIIAVVATHFKLSRHTLLGEQRSSNIVFPRHIICFLSKKYGYSLHHIGRALSRDHSTIYHGISKIGQQAAVDPVLRDQLEIIEDDIYKFRNERIAATREFLE